MSGDKMKGEMGDEQGVKKWVRKGRREGEGIIKDY